ncbi:DUF3795 domain-containing protein [Methanoculleus sp. FWC-SCC1]|uniref:DUF3795 domain-containing protein n=1 Tax=Methanoculleus frigidifontis TaxID=2584085 RepID=A0ABT8MBD9_9EURY|nr:DUF3795 domain-containing protein [Methanoculleus sp. FWC-SCC1]
MPVYFRPAGLCGECEYRAQTGCRGCTAIHKPFWGDSCPLKTCCEAKGLENCGQCEEFPCEALIRFAFDESQGDDGRRIAQCRAWCGE